MAEDWVERSHRVAAAMVRGAAVASQGIEVPVAHTAYNALVELVADAYRQGAIDGLTRAQEIMAEVSP